MDYRLRFGATVDGDDDFGVAHDLQSGGLVKQGARDVQHPVSRALYPFQCVEGMLTACNGIGYLRCSRLDITAMDAQYDNPGISDTPANSIVNPFHLACLQVIEIQIPSHFVSI
jgi:hypothetical protein